MPVDTLGTGMLSPAGYAVTHVSLVCGLVGAALSPWLHRSRRAALAANESRAGRGCGGSGCLCCMAHTAAACCCLCGGDPVAVVRALVTGAGTAWYLFVLLGTVTQEFAEATCADISDALEWEGIGTELTCVRTVRALVWWDQRALVFGAYLAAAVMCSLVLDTRATNALVAAAVSACACALLGGDRVLLDAHRRAGVAVCIGLSATLLWGWLVGARTQAVVSVSSIAAAAATATTTPHTPTTAAAATAAKTAASVAPAAAGAAEYGDAPAHVWALIICGAVEVNMSAWLLYWNAREPEHGWPALVRGNGADTWVAIVPGLLVGVAWAALQPPLFARARAAVVACERAQRARRRARRASARREREARTDGSVSPPDDGAMDDGGNGDASPLL